MKTCRLLEIRERLKKIVCFADLFPVEMLTYEDSLSTPGFIINSMNAYVLSIQLCMLFFVFYSTYALLSLRTYGVIN